MRKQLDTVIMPLCVHNSLLNGPVTRKYARFLFIGKGNEQITGALIGTFYWCERREETCDSSSLSSTYSVLLVQTRNSSLCWLFQHQIHMQKKYCVALKLGQSFEVSRLGIQCRLQFLGISSSFLASSVPASSLTQGSYITSKFFISPFLASVVPG